MNIGILGTQEDFERLAPHVSFVGTFNPVGYYDADDIRNQGAGGFFRYFDEFLSRVDGLLVCKTHSQHLSELLIQSMRNGKHLMLEGFSPALADSIEELLKWNEEAGVYVHMASLPRLQPAVSHLVTRVGRVSLVRSEKLIAPEGTVNGWLKENLFEQADIISAAVGGEHRSVKVSPVAVFSRNPNLYKFHIEFVNGAVADITLNSGPAGERSVMKFYGPSSCYELDLVDQTIAQIRPGEDNGQLGIPGIDGNEHPHFEKVERRVGIPVTFTQELRDFYSGIKGSRRNTNSLAHTLEANRLAKAMSKALDKSLAVLS